MAIIRMCLLCDGTSDTCLEDVVQWLMSETFPGTLYQIVQAREVIPARAPLPNRLVKTLDLYQPDLILCHRDAEGAGLDARRQEIADALTQTKIAVKVVAIVPVRMLESWLLFDEAAIRHAANNKNGNSVLNLPSPNRTESLPDPKARLFSSLEVASELPPRRRRHFNVHHARSRITGFIQSYAPLRVQRGFQVFEEDFVDAVRGLTNN